MNKKLSQKDAIYEIIKDLLGDQFYVGIDARPLLGHSKTSIGSETLLNQAISRFIGLVNTGEINHPKKRNTKKELDQHELKTYSRRIIINWLNKDTRLNGGERYTPLKSEANIFNQDTIINLLRNIRYDIKPVNPPKYTGRSANFYPYKPVYSKDAIALFQEIEEVMTERKDSLRKYNNDLYLVMKCLTDPTLQEVVKIFYQHSTKEPDPFKNLESLQIIEAIFLEVIKLVREEVIKDHKATYKKSA